MTAARDIPAAEIRRLIARRHAALKEALQATVRSATVARVHRARVLARGLRALLATLGPCLGKGARARARRDLRNLAAELGERREADVRQAWLTQLAASSGALAPGAHRRLVEALESERRRSGERLRRHLASTAFRERLARLEATLLSPRLVKGREVPAALLRQRLRRRWEKVRKGLRSHGDDPVALHRLRIDVKKARYASDALAPLLGIEKPAAQGQLKRLQDALGDYRDATEALEWLSGLGEPSGPVLATRMARPIARVRRLRLEQLGRLAAEFEVPALAAWREVRAGPGRRSPAGDGPARRSGGRRAASR